MKKIIFFILLMTLGFKAYAETYENLILEIKRNIDNKDYAMQLGQHLQKNRTNILPVKESLRQAVIINQSNKETIISFMENAGILTKIEKEELLGQVKSYNEIVSKLNESVSSIDKELSYTTYRCTKIESRIYEPNIIVPFKRGLKISDVSAYQDFFKFANSQNVSIVTIPSVDKVIDHISNKENINFIGLEEKLIYNNATATSMYNKVNMGTKTYYMFPYRMYPYEASSLEELTALEYGWFALNLKLVGLLTPEIYNTYKKIFRRNASLCLYSKS